MPSEPIELLEPAAALQPLAPSMSTGVNRDGLLWIPHSTSRPKMRYHMARLDKDQLQGSFSRMVFAHIISDRHIQSHHCVLTTLSTDQRSASNCYEILQTLPAAVQPALGRCAPRRLNWCIKDDFRKVNTSEDITLQRHKELTFIAARQTLILVHEQCYLAYLLAYIILLSCAISANSSPAAIPGFVVTRSSHCSRGQSGQADQGPRTASGLKTAPGLPLLGSQTDMSRDLQRKPPLPTEALDLIRPDADTNVSSPKAKDHRAKVTSPVKSPQHRMSPGSYKENAYGRGDTKSTRVITTDFREARKVDVFTAPHTPPKERPSNRTQNHAPAFRGYEILSPHARAQATSPQNTPTSSMVRKDSQSPQKFVYSPPTAHGSPSTPTPRPRDTSAEIADIVSRIPRTTIRSTPQSTPHRSPLSTPRRRTVYADTSTRLLADTRGEIEWVKGVGIKRADDHHELEIGQDVKQKVPVIESDVFPLTDHSTSEHHARAKEIRWISEKDGFEVVLEGKERPVIAAKSVSRVCYCIERRMFHLVPNKLLASASFGDVLLEIGGDDSTPFRFRSLVENRFGATKVDKEDP
ncbi:MAG: hypothetical protein Q9187_006417, partial [Circinaria calcarea]